jgi:hypothetical protein
MFELDHFFICVDFGAPEADVLVEFGLTEGTRNMHPGQGTANRRFFFRNGFLELLWVSDPAEAQSDTARPTQLWPRWSGRGKTTSPFGIALRPSRPGAEVPFPSREYRPPYLPSNLCIHLGESVRLAEPAWFYLGFGRRPDAAQPPIQPLEHAVGFREISHLHVSGPYPKERSTAASAALEQTPLTLEESPNHRMEITFDHAAQRRLRDFRPILPLVFRW